MARRACGSIFRMKPAAAEAFTLKFLGGSEAGHRLGSEWGGRGMRALVIDDQQLVLEGLEALLQVSMPDLSLDKTSRIDVALRLVTSVQYEVVLLDWHLIGGDSLAVHGDSVIKAMREVGAQVPILVISGDASKDWRQLVLKHGLSGMVPKSASGSMLVSAIEVVTHGGIFLPAATGSGARIPDRRRTAPSQPPDPREQFPELTPRQAEVFGGMARGLSDKQIARELGISDATVKTHVRSVLGIVGVGRRGEAVFKLTQGAPDA